MKSFKRNATVRNLISGLAAIYLTTTPLHAGELSAVAGESIELGRFHGVIYHTIEDDGFRVVATIADGEAGLPVRFSAILADNHTTTISVPGELGEAAHSLEISRSGDKLTLKEVGPSSTAGSPEMQATAE